MITLDLNVASGLNKVKVCDEVLLNALLSQHPFLIKKIIKTICPFYKISESFFEIVNNYVDFRENGVSIYIGLIVRCGLYDYALLYLDGSSIDEEYMLKSIDDYIREKGDYNPKEVNIDKFEIDKKLFLTVLKNI